ncbi:hypothetical protein ARMSODRAFT_965160 [Armillaria solidipes]|uniref:Uncharacterized protein n=1 Tax=Armillaria solidipes TaxID=1076256 RepID=A0A2H3AQS9_9AGAR|nr:hypothetical protein ARMSODRAFT_965160 [Armillaria solidipes]
MGAIRNITPNVYNICPDDESDKEVFIEAAGSSYNGVERHVLMYWDNGTLNQARVVQVIKIVGIPGDYTFKPPVARLHRPMQDPDTSFFLGEFNREERDIILELARKVKFDERSTRNGCRIWLRDLLEAMIHEGFISDEAFEVIDQEVPLVKRRPEVDQ